MSPVLLQPHARRAGAMAVARGRVGAIERHLRHGQDLPERRRAHQPERALGNEHGDQHAASAEQADPGDMGQGGRGART